MAQPQLTLEEKNTKKLRAVEATREDGNRLFKEGQYAQAYAVYNRGTLIAQGTYGLEGEQQTQMDVLESLLELNQSFCQIKLGDNRLAIQHANSALRNTEGGSSQTPHTETTSSPSQLPSVVAPVQTESKKKLEGPTLVRETSTDRQTRTQTESLSTSSSSTTTSTSSPLLGSTTSASPPPSGSKTKKKLKGSSSKQSKQTESQPVPLPAAQKESLSVPAQKDAPSVSVSPSPVSSENKESLATQTSIRRKAYFRLAQAYTALGEYEEALTQIEKARCVCVCACVCVCVCCMESCTTSEIICGSQSVNEYEQVRSYMCMRDTY